MLLMQEADEEGVGQYMAGLQTVLVHGLTVLAKEKPCAQPVEALSFLGQWLLDNNPNKVYSQCLVHFTPAAWHMCKHAEQVLQRLQSAGQAQCNYVSTSLSWCGLQCGKFGHVACCLLTSHAAVCLHCDICSAVIMCTQLWSSAVVVSNAKLL